MNRVWITGIGAVSAAGADVPALAALLGRGAAAATRDEVLGAAFGVAPDPKLPREARHLDRAARLFLAAGLEAWRQAGLPASLPDGDRVAVIEGSSIGAMRDLLDEYRAHVQRGDRLGPSALVRYMPGAGGSVLSQLVGARGAVLHVSAGSVSATCAIGEAWLKVAGGLADVALAGGAECPRHPDIVSAFRAAGILAEGPGQACRPFDAERSGTVLGEGAGALVLEAEAHAGRRGALPLAVLTGYGLAAEAYSMTAPEPTGAGVRSAVTQALAERGAGGLAWIKAHGTGTVLNDLAECRGLASALEGRLAEVPMTSLKSALGHCLGASGAVEAVATVAAMRGGFVPATVGTRHPDPALPRCRVAMAPEAARHGEVLLLSESFGGRCAALTVAAA